MGKTKELLHELSEGANTPSHLVPFIVNDYERRVINSERCEYYIALLNDVEMYLSDQVTDRKAQQLRGNVKKVINGLVNLPMQRLQQLTQAKAIGKLTPEREAELQDLNKRNFLDEEYI